MEIVEPAFLFFVFIKLITYGQSQNSLSRVRTPKGWRKPEILFGDKDYRPSEPDPVSAGVGIGLKLLGLFILA
jgi:hypothetical protein